MSKTKSYVGALVTHRSKPTPPVRMTGYQSVDIPCNTSMTVQEFAELVYREASKYTEDPGNFVVTFGETDIYFRRDESDYDFQVRMREYEVDLAKYWAWKEENADKFQELEALRQRMVELAKELS
jgi:hypothetical protein